MYKEGHVDGALLKYTMLAELGYEVAQSNVAYVLDQGMEGDYIQSNSFLLPGKVNPSLVLLEKGCFICFE